MAGIGKGKEGSLKSILYLTREGKLFFFSRWGSILNWGWGVKVEVGSAVFSFFTLLVKARDKLSPVKVTVDSSLQLVQKHIIYIC